MKSGMEKERGRWPVADGWQLMAGGQWDGSWQEGSTW